MLQEYTIEINNRLGEYGKDAGWYYRINNGAWHGPCDDIQSAAEDVVGIIRWRQKENDKQIDNRNSSIKS